MFRLQLRFYKTLNNPGSYQWDGRIIDRRSFFVHISYFALKEIVSLITPCILLAGCFLHNGSCFLEEWLIDREKGLSLFTRCSFQEADNSYDTRDKWPSCEPHGTHMAGPFRIIACSDVVMNSSFTLCCSLDSRGNDNQDKQMLHIALDVLRKQPGYLYSI